MYIFNNGREFEKNNQIIGGITPNFSTFTKYR